MDVDSNQVPEGLFTRSLEVSTQEIHDWFAKSEPQIPRATVNWRVYQMVRSGRLVRVRRGRFKPGNGGKPVWVPIGSNHEVTRILSEEFPLATSCQWSTEAIGEFQQHVSSSPFAIIEVERDALPGVFYRIKEVIPDTFLEPSRKVVEEYVTGRRNVVVVKTLISESPLSGSGENRRPTLEKVLVDLVADSDLFFYLQGVELGTIYQNAQAKYELRIDRLLRYARRRGREGEVIQLLNPLETSS
ncbi:MAG: DUF6577 family protein [Spirochaetales bacterium]